MANKVPEEVIPRFIDAARIGFPRALQLLQVDAAGAIEEAVGEPRERDGARDRGGRGGLGSDSGGVEAPGRRRRRR